MAPFQMFAARLTSSTSLSGVTKHLEFEIKAVPRFGFVAGQWLSFKTTKPDGEEITRAYSILRSVVNSNASKIHKYRNHSSKIRTIQLCRRRQHCIK